VSESLLVPFVPFWPLVLAEVIVAGDWVN
jgi:hypothetical protein